MLLETPWKRVEYHQMVETMWGKSGMGKLYVMMTKAKADRDIGAFNSCYHDDWEFKFNSSGRIVRRGENTDEQTL